MSTARRNALSLQARITVLLAVAIFVTVGVVAATATWLSLGHTRQALQDESKTIGGLLAENTAGAIRFGHANKLEPVFEALKRFR